MRRMICLFLAAVFLAAGALAAGEGGGKRKLAPPNEVELPFLMAPVIRNGELFGYLYIASKLVTPSAGSADKVKAKLAYVQDALVRDVNKTPISGSTDPEALDREALKTRLAAVAGRIVGPANVGQMVLLSVKFAPLHEGAPQTTLPQGGPDAGAGGLGQQNGQTAAKPGNSP